MIKMVKKSLSRSLTSKGFYLLKFGPDVEEGLKFHLEQQKK